MTSRRLSEEKQLGPVIGERDGGPWGWAAGAREAEQRGPRFKFALSDQLLLPEIAQQTSEGVSGVFARKSRDLLRTLQARN